jgi:hypothetical protein
MFYAANIPLSRCSTSKISYFKYGLNTAIRNGHRPQYLYGEKEKSEYRIPLQLPPLQNKYFEKYHPLQGNLTKATDRDKIGQLVDELIPFMIPLTVEYVGERNEYGEKHGYGEETFENGKVYRGNWINGKMEGVGTMIYPNGNSYTGDWVDNMACGKGINGNKIFLYLSHHVGLRNL